jgi:hypothetical protein
MAFIGPTEMAPMAYARAIIASTGTVTTRWPNITARPGVRVGSTFTMNRSIASQGWLLLIGDFRSEPGQ